MRVLHFSDNHGRMPNEWSLDGIDLVICTGDFFPTATRQLFNGRHVWAGQEADMELQMEWAEEKLPSMARWLGDVPFLWCGGNHDWITPVGYLRKHGAKAYDATNHWFEQDEVVFYGFPYIPYIEGTWNFEREQPEMREEWDAFLEKVEAHGSMPDVLLMHAPMRGVLDKCTLTGNRYGDPVRLNSLTYYPGRMPQHILHGHVHNPAETILRLGGQDVHISNSATTHHIFEV